MKNRKDPRNDTEYARRPQQKKDAEDRAAQIPVPDDEPDEDLAKQEDSMLGDFRDGESDRDGDKPFGPLPSDTKSSSSKQRYRPYFTDRHPAGEPSDALLTGKARAT